MKNMIKISVIILILLFVFSDANAMGRQLRESSILNKEAPDFSLYNIEGGKASLLDFKNKNNVMLFFWFTSCPFCLREIAILNKVYPEMQKSNIEFLSINVGDDANTVKKYIKESDVAFPILLDKESAVAFKYDLVGVPTYVIIDKKGIVKLITNGFPENYKELLSK